MARYRITERQVVTYTWVVDTEDIEGLVRDGLDVPDFARSKLLESETSYEEEA